MLPAQCGTNVVDRTGGLVAFDEVCDVDRGDLVITRALRCIASLLTIWACSLGHCSVECKTAATPGLRCA
jgi:hypothetical protein